MAKSKYLRPRNESGRMPALEKNILLYRTIQIGLVLHKAQSFREYLIGSLESTNKILGLHKAKQIAVIGKNPLDKALNYLVQEKILSEPERKQLEDALEHRNDAAHRFYQLMADISKPDFFHGLKRFNYGASKLIDHYRLKIEKALTGKMITQISLDSAVFERAERAYMEELRRLEERIDRLYQIRHRQVTGKDPEPLPVSKG